ncbi:MAG: HAMP domain-containing protein, partial [Planctomycetes bacterium]|nr:HAMP domain-containing protein [Planctomycetota bacterium]
MLRRISTKLVLAVLLAVVLPFVAFAFFIDEQMAGRLTRHVVQQALLGLVKDLAGQIDYFVDERRQDLEQWAGAPHIQDALDDYLTEKGQARLELERRGKSPLSTQLTWNAEALARLTRREVSSATYDFGLGNRWQATHEFNRTMDIKVVYDLLLLVSSDGRLVTCSSRYPRGPVLGQDYLERLFVFDFGTLDWYRRARGEFEGAVAEPFVRVDQHVSPFHLGPDPEAGALDPAWNYQLGFAVPVKDPDTGEVRGVLYALVNWKHVQDLVSTEVVTDAFRGHVREDREPSPYAWLWAEDADTILAHRERELYGKRVSAELGLPQLTQAVLEDEDGSGLYPEYTFGGEKKNAAFHRCRASLADGFGWVVGVGINNDDIFATADELRALLLGGTAVVLVLAVCLTLFIARRTTAPVRELQRHARRVAEGDLDARIEIRSRDELGALAEDFNRMTSELKAQRERIVKAEKDAAWREMARQIAHDIKNPLTPITLSLDLLERARRDQHQDSEEILARTMGLMRRQVENLREIANDFYEFTGGRKAHPVAVDVGALLEEVLHLHDAWAVERGVAVQREGASARVWADLGKLRRVLVNLVSNALQAMPEGGSLLVATSVQDGRVWITIRDTGTGIAAEARAHLFEPYFTTKSEGTGLGLAIARRAIEEMGGEIELVAAPDGVGTL